jgi:hypothetical protein
LPAGAAARRQVEITAFASGDLGIAKGKVRPLYKPLELPLAIMPYFLTTACLLLHPAPLRFTLLAMRFTC